MKYENKERVMGLLGEIARAEESLSEVHECDCVSLKDARGVNRFSTLIGLDDSDKVRPIIEGLAYDYKKAIISELSRQLNQLKKELEEL